jgi:hypothetical protein
MPASDALKLRLHSGVPIVEVLGSWEPAVTEALSEMIGALASAGHYDIVVNVQRAALDGISALQSLSRTVQAVRSHCGHLDVVGTVEQIDELIRQQMVSLFRLAPTEECAIGRIKRIPVLTTGLRCTARPLS